MKRKKILKALTEILDGKARRHRRHRTELEALMSNLQTKLVKLEQKLEIERHEGKKKRWRQEMEIIKAQQEKGMNALKGLDAS